MSGKHTIGKAESLEGLEDESGEEAFIISSTPFNDAYSHQEIATVCGFKSRINEANAARLCAGWNLLNRLEAAKIRPEWLLENLDEVFGLQVESDCNRLDVRD